MNSSYLILPGCDDTNRGDQALIWETVRIAKDAGYCGNYYMIATEECSAQSKKEGIERIDYILPHPSHHIAKAKDKDNVQYGSILFVKWAFWALIDLLIALPLLFGPTRTLIAPFLTGKKKRTLDVYKGSRAAFVKGGGFLHAYGGLTEAYKIFFFLYHINLAISMKIPVYVMPNSFGPFDGPLVKRMIRSTLKKCHFVSARESISENMLLKQCGINSYRTNDLAVYLEKDVTFDAENELLKSGILLKANKSVAITVRPYRFPGSTNTQELYKKYKDSIVEFIRWLMSNGFQPVLVEHTYSDSFHEQDMVCIREINELLSPEACCPVFSNLELTCKEMKSIYSAFDYIVGTRFHSLIFSLTELVPGIAITYGGNKGQGIMNDLGLKEYSISIDELDSVCLIEKFKSLASERDNIRSSLSGFVAQTNKDRELLKEMIRKRDE